MTALAAHVAEALRASDDRIVVAGAGGWIGLATIDLLREALGDQFDRRVGCFGSNHRDLILKDGTTVVQHPLGNLSMLAPAPTILLHLAFLTKDRAEAMDEEDFRAANRAIDDQVLTALEPIGVRALFVASSGAAERADDPAASPAMRLYGDLKREQEERFASWADRTGHRAVIARLFNLSGPYINKHSSYALASFILDALADKPVHIRAPHTVVRSFVAIRELMSLVFALLCEDDTSLVRFDSGGKPMEMQEIASVVAAQLGNIVDRPTFAAQPVDDYTGNAVAYDALLARHGIDPVPFAQQVAETVEYLSFSNGRTDVGGLASGRPA